MRALKLGCILACAVMSLAMPVTSLGQAHATTNNLDLVVAARRQIGVTTGYDGSYQSLDYPGGDVPMETGVCTDVVVRALRQARGLDLQQLVHEDFRAHPAAYARPATRPPARPDSNIDHRRVPNQMAWLDRAGYSMPIAGSDRDYLPGDIVAWNLGGGILHIGIVSDRKSAAGTPLVIHNIGSGAREEDILRRFRIIGHYRLAARGPRPGHG